jgi:hypothetical protein
VRTFSHADLMPMKPTTTALALLAALLASPPAHAQDELPRRLTLEESESYQMSMELAFACSPYRHRRADGSQSTIRRASDALPGTAVHFSSIEGTYLVLERYDQELDGHCLVIGWFGGTLEPGSHRIARLAMATVEAQAEAGDHSFFGMSAVRTPRENVIVVVESGTLEIVSKEEGRLTGTFELDGFVVEGGTDRVEDVTWAGSFVAVEGAD